MAVEPPSPPLRGIWVRATSASRDGGFLAAILECFGVQPVRGSTSRRGAQALLELTGWAERGYDLAITPDGPRGPCYVVQEGALVGVLSLGDLVDWIIHRQDEEIEHLNHYIAGSYPA